MGKHTPGSWCRNTWTNGRISINWMEIAEDHDKRDYDYEAVEAAKNAMEKAGGKQV